VTTERGSDPGLAGSGTVGGISTERAGMEVVAGVTERAGRVFGPIEAIELVVWADKCVPALCSSCEGGSWATCRGGVSFAVIWHVSCETTSKA